MDFMQEALNEAKKGIRKKAGGPFGAIIVKNNRIIARSHNEVLKSHDPTSHAEILVIRRAAKKLKTHNLSNCILYTSCEPCPMCFSAIHWARIKKVYYSASRIDAAKIGFDDNKIYQELQGKKKPSFKLIKIDSDYKSLFKEFKLHKTLY